MNNYRILFCVIFALLFSKTSAQVKFQRSWLYTATNTLDLNSINPQRFKLLKEKDENPPFHNGGTYWFRIDIQNPNPDKDLIIDIPSAHLDSVFLFQQIGNKITLTDTTGNNFKYRNNISFRYNRVKVGGNTTKVWLKTHLKKEFVFPVDVQTLPNFYQSEHMNFLLIGLYYGLIILVLIGNIVLYFFFKDFKFLYYSIFILMIALLFAYSDGLYVLISTNPNWLNYANLPFKLGASVAGVFFSVKFLELGRNYLYLHWTSIVLLTFSMFCYIAFVLFGWPVAAVIASVIGLFLFILYWLVALSRFRLDIAARFFVIAYGLSIFFALDYFVFRKMGFNLLNLTPGEFKFTNILQMLILSTGIAYRARQLHTEHAYFREEIQRYLQQKSSLDKKEEVLIALQNQFGLSEREIEVLKLLTTGLNNQQIGERIYLSVNTVKFHIRNIYVKMKISNRAQALNIIHESIHQE